MKSNPELLKQHHDYLWTRYAIIAIAVLLLADIDTFAVKTLLIKWNNFYCGVLLLIFGALAFSYKNAWAAWIVAGIGIWLQLIPEFFWAVTSYEYFSNTLLGALVVAFSVIIPGSPGLVENKGPEVPQGWSYNPSSWLQRVPIITLTYLCWLCARYMAAYQLGYIDHVWDPFFKDGTLHVITSPLSRAFPFSDAGLGAAAYLIEFLMGCKGSSRRWHTMPWMVLFFGLLVIPVGLASIILIMMQPLLVGYWCGWCLITALFMLLMICLTVDEVFAVLQYLIEAKSKHKPVWKVFWKGSLIYMPEGTEDRRTPVIGASPRKLISPMLWGTTASWQDVATAILGGVILFSRDLFHPQGVIADLMNIFGALIVACAIISFADVARKLRMMNVLFGFLVAVISSLGYPQSGFYGPWPFLILGVLIIALSIKPREPTERFGLWTKKRTGS